MIADDDQQAVSHYLVWTCCPANTVRAGSAAGCKDKTCKMSDAAGEATSEGAVSQISDASVTPGDDGLHAALSCDNSKGFKAASVNVTDEGPPAKISRSDQCSVAFSSAPAYKAAVFDAAQTGLPHSALSLDDDRTDDVKLPRDNAHETADLNTADSGLPAKIIHEDQCIVDTNITSVWRCLGLTPVASFGVKYKNLLLDYHRNFRVQPILFSGTVLPCIGVVIR